MVSRRPAVESDASDRHILDVVRCVDSDNRLKVADHGLEHSTAGDGALKAGRGYNRIVGHIIAVVWSN
jgi:hypothetical protein